MNELGTQRLAKKPYTACYIKNTPLEFFERNYTLYRDEKTERINLHKFHSE